MAIDKITDHQQRAKDRLPGFMQGAVNLENLLATTNTQLQELEDAFFQLLDERHLSVAVGLQLDGIGQILDLEREVGESDEDYRSALIGRRGELAKGGEPETLITAYLSLTGQTILKYTELYPAKVEMIILTDTDPEDPVADATTVQVMDNTKAGGVELDLRMAPATNYFWFSDESEVDGSNNGPITAEHGFGDEALTEGGGLARTL